jgi:hypothetical protein
MMISGQQRGEYLRYGLKDPNNPHISYDAQTSFDKDVIAEFKAVLPKSRGGVLPDDDAWTEDQIPIKMRMFPGAIEVTYDLHGEYCQLYSNDIVDEAGQVVKGKAKGDVICGRNGLPKVYTSIQIMCAQGYVMEDVWDENAMDWAYNPDGTIKQRPVKDPETGNYKRTWLHGYSPEQVGDARKAMMVPYTDALRRKFNVQPEDDDDISVDEEALFNGPSEGAPAETKPAGATA